MKKQKVKLFIEVNAIIHDFEHREQLESLDVHVDPNDNSKLNIIGWAALMGNKIVLTKPNLVKYKLVRK